MEIDQDDWIIPFASRDTPVTPIFRRGVARGENKFEIFAVGDFGGVERRGGKEINRQEKRPEVAEPASIFGVMTSHYCPCDVFESMGDQPFDYAQDRPIAPTSFLPTLRSLWLNLFSFERLLQRREIHQLRDVDVLDARLGQHRRDQSIQSSFVYHAILGVVVFCHLVDIRGHLAIEL